MYELFDFEEVINFIRRKNEKEDGKDALLKLIEDIPAGSSIEDLPLYRDYLARFDVEHAFDGIELMPPDIGTKADLDLLQRFICASFSSTYDLTYYEERQKYIMAINVTSKNKDGEEVSITKTLDELWSFQLYRLYEIYLEEMLALEVDRNEDDDYKECIDDEREAKLVVFKQKVRKLKREKEKKNREQKNREESLALEFDLDELLSR